MVLPRGQLLSPTLSFDHYVATEAGYDGGNVKYSLNGKPFKVIPASAYTFNGPKVLATEADGSTNPLAGEDGFTGTDGGKVTGSWGQSQVNLAALGAKGGSNIRLRFDIGRDGCGGIDGWYVDNVTDHQLRGGRRSRAVADHREGADGQPEVRSGLQGQRDRQLEPARRRDR